MWLCYVHTDALEDRVQHAFQFSSKVSLEDPHELLFEVGSAVRYFGTISRLLVAAHDLIQVERWALTPYPEASLWCARQALNRIINSADLKDVLSRLPLEVMRVSPKTLLDIQGCGLQHVGDLYGMPRATLLRRWGKDLVMQLEESLGASRPRPLRCPPERFYEYVLLEDPLLEWRYAQAIVESLVSHALRWAGLRGQCIRQLRLTFDHGRQKCLHIPVSTDSGDSKDIWMHLIPLAIEKAGFQDWIVGIALEILELRASQPDSGELWPGSVRHRRDLHLLLETLETRLGAESIEALYCYPDHRPERAYLKDVPGQAYGSSAPTARRPSWLLPKPEPLGETPYRGGRLQLLSGPERIESGWWEGQEVRRDYFVAAHPSGSLYWIFRECEGRGHWFLHGIFA